MATSSLLGARKPEVSAMEIDVSVFGGRVVIKPPVSWKVGPGRIAERAMRLDGTLDWVNPALSPSHIPAKFDFRPWRARPRQAPWWPRRRPAQTALSICSLRAGGGQPAGPGIGSGGGVR
jgi:hypothetical protein